MKTLIALLLVALAIPALADPKTSPAPAKKANLDAQDRAINKGMEEAGRKADIAMRPAPPSNPPVTGVGAVDGLTKSKSLDEAKKATGRDHPQAIKDTIKKRR